MACRYNLLDTAVALNAAFFVNAAILILSAAVFHRHNVAVASIEEAYKLLPAFLGSSAPILFGVALLCAGQSSTVTGTLAGQIVMEGYLHMRIAPWLRRLVTRLIALVPAVVVIYVSGEGATQRLLVLSQVILSLQLSFAVIPLIHFTSNRRNMGVFATPPWAQALAWLTAAIIVSLNGKLVYDQIGGWVAWARESGGSLGPIPTVWPVAALLYGVAAAVLLLLTWVTIKPWVRPAPAWTPAPSVQLDWVRMLRPRPLATIGVALEHNQADSEILNRALSLAQPGQTALVLLHVVDTPIVARGRGRSIRTQSSWTLGGGVQAGAGRTHGLIVTQVRSRSTAAATPYRTAATGQTIGIGPSDPPDSRAQATQPPIWS
jgi:manganese transport protein